MRPNSAWSMASARRFATFMAVMLMASHGYGAEVTDENTQKIKALESQVEKLQASLSTAMKQISSANAEIKRLNDHQAALSNVVQIQSGKIVINSSGAIELRANSSILLKSNATTIDAGLVNLGSGSSRVPATYQGAPVSVSPSGSNGTVLVGSKSVLIAR
ncbi:hypothetical protein [Zhongshania sp. BJYM1]|jgi:cell division protein FtsB|uniref:hypothetical protein n=1 Tax=Zhongshania aquatica TaxID=2965069 RepID=UPI0022B5C5EC|nr:hypothetical protein [Marortus sp. BJYM1]